MLLLSSEDQEGCCYITTANLDGETNLKVSVCVCVCVCESVLCACQNACMHASTL